MGRLGGLGLVGRVRRVRRVGLVGRVGAVNKNEIIWLAPVVVNDNCEIISFALGMCDDNPQHLCFVYL